MRRRFSSMLLRAIVALMCIALLSLGIITAYFFRRMARTQRAAQYEYYEKALDSLCALLDDTFYDYMSYAGVFVNEKMLRPINISADDTIACTEAIEFLNSLKVCNRSVIDLCLYYVKEDFFITSTASYTQKSFMENYYTFSALDRQQTLAFFLAPTQATSEYGSTPAFIPVGKVSRWDLEDQTDGLLILYPLPYWSHSPYATLGILVHAAGVIDQLSLAAGEGSARIIAATGETLLCAGEERIDGGFNQSGDGVHIFLKHSQKFNLDYEICVREDILRRVGIPAELAFFVLGCALLLGMGCLFFARWVNQPVRQILTHIGESDKLISDESSLIRRHISQLGEHVARSQRYVDELILRRLIAGQDVEPEALSRSDSVLRLDYAHCAVFLVRLDRLPEAAVSLTCLEREHAVVYVMQEARRDMLTGVIACDKTKEALCGQVESLLGESVLRGAQVIAIGELEDDPYQLHRSAVCADALMSEMLYQGKSGIAISDGHQERRGAYPVEHMHEFRQALEEQNADSLRDACEKICTFLTDSSATPESAALVLYDLSCLLPGMAVDMDEPARALCEELRRCVQKKAECFSIPGQSKECVSDSDEWVHRTTNFIAQTLESPDFGISFMAQNYGMSDSAFSHMFKRSFGVSFIAYVNQVKIQRAKEMLAGTVLSVDDIAHTLGYSSSSNFTRMFKSVEQMTPSLYRQNARRTGQEVGPKETKA